MIKQKMLKINKIVKSVCFHLVPYIHSPVKGFFRTNDEAYLFDKRFVKWVCIHFS